MNRLVRVSNRRRLRHGLSSGTSNLGRIVALLLTSASWFSGAGVATADSCTECHSGIPNKPSWEHSYTDWEESLHANLNVDCHSCHGGNDTEKSPQHAHKGMTPVGGGDTVEDRLMAARVCGSCHPDQYWGFSHSIHYKRLKSGELSAYCHTCHTSVGSKVLTPKTITAACRDCHTDTSPGNVADTATTLLDHLYRIRLALSFRDPDMKLTPDEWKTVEESAIAAMAAWHEFNLEAVGLALAHGTGVLEQ